MKKTRQITDILVRTRPDGKVCITIFRDNPKWNRTYTVLHGRGLWAAKHISFKERQGWTVAPWVGQWIGFEIARPKKEATTGTVA